VQLTSSALKNDAERLTSALTSADKLDAALKIAPFGRADASFLGWPATADPVISVGGKPMPNGSGRIRPLVLPVPTDADSVVENQPPQWRYRIRFAKDKRESGTRLSPLSAVDWAAASALFGLSGLAVAFLHQKAYVGGQRRRFVGDNNIGQVKFRWDTERSVTQALWFTWHAATSPTDGALFKVSLHQEPALPKPTLTTP
jgi:hypothetical protein